MMVKLRNWISHNDAQWVDDDERKILTCFAHKAIDNLAEAAKKLDEAESNFQKSVHINVKAIQRLIGDTDSCEDKICKMSPKEINDKLPEFPVVPLSLFREWPEKKAETQN